MRKIFIPKWEGPVQGYTVNYLRKNYWRIVGVIEEEDMMQEAKCIFYMVKRRYSYIDNGGWFMALYKTALTNLINDLSCERMDRLSNTMDTNLEIALNFRRVVEENQGYLVCLIEQAPEEVRAVLNLLSSAPKELLDDIASAWKAQGKRKIEGSKHLSKLLGYDSDIDLIKLVRDYFLF